jgi:hypothetical protein
VPLIGPSIFAFLAATLIVPAGAELVGSALGWLGVVLIRHGVALRAAYYSYIAVWREK